MSDRSWPPLPLAVLRRHVPRDVDIASDVTSSEETAAAWER